jgi:hypothetical protein
MTKEQLLDILALVDEVSGKAAADKAEAEVDPSLEKCLDLKLINTEKTEDGTTMYMYEGKLCKKLPLIVVIEKHNTDGIRIESINGIPGAFLRGKFKKSFLGAMAENFSELRVG